MRQRTWLSACLLVACSPITLERDPRPALVLDPPGGTYDHGLVVAVRSADGQVVGTYEIKPEGGAFAGLETNGECAWAEIDAGTCVPISESRSFAVRERDSNGNSSPETEGRYVINSPKLDVTVNAVVWPEIHTSCSYRPDGAGKHPRVRIKIDLDAAGRVTPSSKLGTLDLTVELTAEPRAGDSFPVPASTFGLDNGAYGTYPKGAQPCTVQFTHFTKGGKVAGSVECPALARTSVPDIELLGPTISIPRADWVCDEWSGLQ